MNREVIEYSSPTFQFNHSQNIKSISHMSFWQRFRFFLIGFVPGCIILIMIINRNGCTSPNELKMLELQHQHLQLGNKAACKLKCLVMIDKGFQVNMRNFKVNYDLSDVHKKPYGLFYLQAINEKDAQYDFVVEDKDTVSFVNDIKLLTHTSNCHCDTVQ